MFKAFYFLLGGIVGAIATYKANENAEKGGASGLTGLVESVTRKIRDFNTDVRDGMNERESELHEALGDSKSTKNSL